MRMVRRILGVLLAIAWFPLVGLTSIQASHDLGSGVVTEALRDLIVADVVVALTLCAIAADKYGHGELSWAAVRGVAAVTFVPLFLVLAVAQARVGVQVDMGNILLVACAFWGAVEVMRLVWRGVSVKVA